MAIGPFGSNLKVSDYELSGVPLVFVRNIRARDFGLVPTFVSNEKAAALSAHLVKPGDVLITKMGDPPGDTAVYPMARQPAILTADCIKVTPHHEIDPRFLAAVVGSPLCAQQISAMTGGVAQQKVSLGKIRKLRIAVPPAGEQSRIVAAIEEAFSKLDAGEAGLRTVRRLLERMRSAVLTAGVTGQLVPQDPTDVPASDLLAALGVEPATVEDHDLPTSWVWTTVEQAGKVDLGRQRHPDWHHGPNMKPYLHVAGNIFEDRIDTSDLKVMHFDPATYERFRLRNGDVLLNEGQSPELLGRPAIYRGDPPDIAFTNSILRFRSQAGIDPEWALLVFRHYMRSGRLPRGENHYEHRPSFSPHTIKRIEFPVPPTDEQDRIVAEVERQFRSSRRAAGRRPRDCPHGPRCADQC